MLKPPHLTTLSGLSFVNVPSFSPPFIQIIHSIQLCVVIDLCFDYGRYHLDEGVILVRHVRAPSLEEILEAEGGKEVNVESGEGEERIHKQTNNIFFK